MTETELMTMTMTFTVAAHQHILGIASLIFIGNNSNNTSTIIIAI
jgi:hypothetical protein